MPSRVNDFRSVGDDVDGSRDSGVAVVSPKRSGQRARCKIYNYSDRESPPSRVGVARLFYVLNLTRLSNVKTMRSVSYLVVMQRQDGKRVDRTEFVNREKYVLVMDWRGINDALGKILGSELKK